jgi:predicted ATPase/predicted Ser/Thr protein kinase
MGVVYRARDERLERDVALKVLPKDRLGDETARKRFRKEAKALSMLNHPNIAAVYDVDTDKGVDFLVMEYITGETLGDKLTRGALEENEVIRFGMQLAEGLIAAHHKGVIHRDLKPGNLRVTSGDRIKILDFGLALLLRSVTDTATTDSRLTDARAAVGTLPYMAPEQLRGEPADERTDIYAMGAVLYEMVTSKRLFPEKQGAHLISAILTQWPAAPREVKEDVSPALERLILKALDKQREHRYQSAAELLEKLQQLSSGVVPIVASAPFLEGKEEPARVEKPVFVAREEELTRLGEFLDKALAGQSRVAFVTGEAGKGKTALVSEFVRRAQEVHTDLIVASGHCDAHTGIGDPYLPFREVLALLTGEVEPRYRAGAISGDHATRLWHCLPVSVQSLVESGLDLIDTFVAGRPLLRRAESYLAGDSKWLAELREIVERKATMPADSRLQQSVLFAQYARILQALAQWKPVVLVLDDLHWADGGSIHLLLHIIQRIEAARLLVIVAFRSDEVAQGRNGEPHPLKSVINECKVRFGDIEVEVGRSGDRVFVDAYLDTEPNRFGSDFRDAFYRHTEGHSLFTVEMLRGLKEQGTLIRDEEGRWLEGAVDWEKLPTRVEATIGARIDRMPEHLKEILTVAGVEGETFTAEVLAGVQQADEREMVRLLSSELDKRYQLVRAQGILREGGRRLSQYRFRHILFQKYLHGTLDEVELAHLHEDVGNVLERLYGERAEEVAVQLSRHFQEAGILEKAIEYLQKAGAKAARLSANEEAVAQFSKALEFLETLPDFPERTQKELSLQLGLAAPLSATRGWSSPEMVTVCTRARELCRQFRETPQLFQALFFLTSVHTIRGELSIALELADQYRSMVERADDPLSKAMAHFILGYLHVFIGDFREALEHCEQVIAFYDPRKHGTLGYVYGQDPGVSCLAWSAWALWFLGYPDRALERSHEAIALARDLGHRYTLAFAQWIAGATLHRFRREFQSCWKWHERYFRLATEEGFEIMRAVGSFERGYAEVEGGRTDQGIEQMRQGLAAMDSAGYRVARHSNLFRLSQALREAGKVLDALEVLSEAMACVQKTGESYFEAEIHRLEGELHLMHKDMNDDAEACFHRAVEVARRQKAKSLELRAVMGLARLWQRQGKKEDARQRLTEIYDWFTEGFDTPDLVDAKVLLEELSSGP